MKRVVILNSKLLTGVVLSGRFGHLCLTALDSVKTACIKLFLWLPLRRANGGDAVLQDAMQRNAVDANCERALTKPSRSTVFSKANEQNVAKALDSN